MGIFHLNSSISFLSSVCNSHLDAFEKPDENTFSSMMSTITAALAARSYSLETLGQHPIQSVTPPLLRPPGIQRGGSLKIPISSTSASMTTSAPSTSRQTQQSPPMPTYNYSASTSAVSSATGRCQRGGSNTGEQPRRIMGERTNVFATPPSAQRRPPASVRPRPTHHADLVYATRVIVSNEPPQDSPPPLPIHRSLAARLTDPEMQASNSCDF
jgi:hypothetical protein